MLALMRRMLSVLNWGYDDSELPIQDKGRMAQVAVLSLIDKDKG